MTLLALLFRFGHGGIQLFHRADTRIRANAFRDIADGVVRDAGLFRETVEAAARQVGQHFAEGCDRVHGVKSTLYGTARQVVSTGF